MKILFCSQTRLGKELGGSKPLLELAEEMREIGWHCDHISPYDFGMPGSEALRTYAANLRRHLIEHAADYDVIDYDHVYLPYPRSDFSDYTLLVARSVLLQHHLQVVRIPRGRGGRAALSALLRGRVRARERSHSFRQAQLTLEQADLINVSNSDDRAELIRYGLPQSKIVVFPFGLSRSRLALFETVSSAVPSDPIVAFVGSFDYRKGAREFPAIVQTIVQAIPDVRFRLLGTMGLFTTREAVLAQFPTRLHDRLDIQPRFDPEDLPTLLSTCSVGIFPSHVEGFGFGVLEMLAASIPVVAYDCPGPPMM